MSNSFATPRTVSYQAPLPMGFPRQEYWSGLSFPTLEDLPNPAIKPEFPALAGGFFTTEQPVQPTYRTLPSVFGQFHISHLWTRNWYCPPRRETEWLEGRLAKLRGHCSRYTLKLYNQSKTKSHWASAGMSLRVALSGGRAAGGAVTVFLCSVAPVLRDRSLRMHCRSLPRGCPGGKWPSWRSQILNIWPSSQGLWKRPLSAASWTPLDSYQPASRPLRASWAARQRQPLQWRQEPECLGRPPSPLSGWARAASPAPGAVCRLWRQDRRLSITRGRGGEVGGAARLPEKGHSPLSEPANDHLSNTSKEWNRI